MRGIRGRGGLGFSLLELMVVIAIILILMGMILGTLSMVRQYQRRLLASKQVHDIVSSCESYFMVFHRYPADTGLVELDGSTINFTEGENLDEAIPDSIYRDLGRKVYEAQSHLKFKNSLLINLRHLRTVDNMQIMVDPWGQPYRLDCVHAGITGNTTLPEGRDAAFVAVDAKITKVGAPYAEDVPLEKQTYSAKAWSKGPDKNEGDVPFSHVESITDGWDIDNVSSWK